MSFEIQGKPDINRILDIINKDDPRKAVDQVIADLNKDLAKISKQMEKSVKEEKEKLRAIATKIETALKSLEGLKSGDNLSAANLDDVANSLKEISKSDPKIASMLKDKIITLEKVSDNLRKLRAEMNAVKAGGVLV